MSLIIKGAGAYLPKKTLSNNDLERIVDTSDEWITQRTGIKNRHIAAEEENTSDLAYQAALEAIRNAKINKDEIDLIIVATTTPDLVFPSVAAKVGNLLDLKGGSYAAFDIQAVCAGFIYALDIARKMSFSSHYKNILVIGAETMSRIVDWKDRNTCVLFGDGAGAFILSESKEDKKGLIYSSIYTDASGYDNLKTAGGVSNNKHPSIIYMDGKDVFKNAISKMSESIIKGTKDLNISVEDIDYFILHQANIRIIEGVASKLNIDLGKFSITVNEHANTSAASIPLSFYTNKEKIKEGSLVSMSAIGGGYCWGSAFFQF